MKATDDNSISGKEIQLEVGVSRHELDEMGRAMKLSNTHYALIDVKRDKDILSRAILNSKNNIMNNINNTNSTIHNNSTLPTSSNINNSNNSMNTTTTSMNNSGNSNCKHNHNININKHDSGVYLNPGFVESLEWQGYSH
jgi:hypothetical protein